MTVRFGNRCLGCARAYTHVDPVAISAEIMGTAAKMLRRSIRSPAAGWASLQRRDDPALVAGGVQTVGPKFVAAEDNLGIDSSGSGIDEVSRVFSAADASGIVEARAIGCWPIWCGRPHLRFRSVRGRELMIWRQEAANLDEPTQRIGCGGCVNAEFGERIGP